MWASSSALAAGSKDVGVSSFNKRWKNSNVVQKDDGGAADGAGKRVLVSDDCRNIIDGIQWSIIPFLASTIFECLSIHLLTLLTRALCAITFLLLLTSFVVLVSHDTRLAACCAAPLHATHCFSSASSRMKARRQPVAGISGSGS